MSTPATAQLPISHPTIDLLTWKDPIRTGKVFGALVATLVVFKTVNLFTLFFRLAYIGLLGTYTRCLS